MKRPPAFVQEIVPGLWSVQELVTPPSGEPYYIGWPGDHRGWMRFESKEAARDFYKFATGKMSSEEFKKLPRAPYSGATIDLDDNGDFVLLTAD